MITNRIKIANYEVELDCLHRKLARLEGITESRIWKKHPIDIKDFWDKQRHFLGLPGRQMVDDPQPENDRMETTAKHLKVYTVTTEKSWKHIRGLQ